MRAAVRGLTDLSETISSRDDAITNLLSDSNTLSASLDGSKDDIAKLVKDAGALLAELDRRQDALRGVIVHTDPVFRSGGDSSEDAAPSAKSGRRNRRNRGEAAAATARDEAPAVDPEARRKAASVMNAIASAGFSGTISGR